MDSSNRTFSVLLADDDPDDRFFAEKAFKDLGIPGSLKMVKNGEELLHYLDQCINCRDQQQFIVPDFILLDLNMPEKNGWEALDEIKIIRGLQDIPVIIWTTSDADEDRLRSIEMGADYFITKPRDYSALLSSIHSLVRIFCGDYKRREVEIPDSTCHKY